MHFIARTRSSSSARLSASLFTCATCNSSCATGAADERRRYSWGMIRKSRPAFASHHAPTQLARGGERREAMLEIGDEVVGVLKPDMQAQRRSPGGPLSDSATLRAIERNDQAFEAAP